MGYPPLSIGIERFIHKKPIDLRRVIAFNTCGHGVLVTQLPLVAIVIVTLSGLLVYRYDLY